MGETSQNQKQLDNFKDYLDNDSPTGNVPALSKLPTNQFIENLISHDEPRDKSQQENSQRSYQRDVTRRESQLSYSYGVGSRQSSASQTRGSKLSRSRKGSAMQREEDLETNLDPSDRQFMYDETGQKTYEYACQKFNALMSRKFHKELPASASITMRHYGAGPRGAKAIAIPMVNNTRVTTLDLSNNDLGKDGIAHLSRMMSENTAVTELNVSENSLGLEGAKQVAAMLHTNHNLRTLTLSGNNFGDKEAPILADAIEEHTMLQYLDLSHNSFGAQGGSAFKKMISENGTLQEVDLSWNNIRMRGAVDLSKAIKENIGLKVFKVAWNGFDTQGAKEMGEALKSNGTLTELDLTCNRIGAEGFTGLLKNIKDNDELKTLRVGRNPITEDAAVAAMELFKKLDDVALHLLDLGEVTLGWRFKEKLKEVKEKHLDFDCVFGYTDMYGKRKMKTYNVVEEAMTLMRAYLEENNMNLAELFTEIDTDGSMSVSYDEFKEGLRAARIPLSDEQIEQLIKALDEDGDGEIDFSELILGAEAVENGE